ncbi:MULTISPECIES: hypothetical protein [Aureimonas]|uniref:Uncharacterized protein n=2 Tax=Aureimonas TaxID=414371 RepID=A0A1H0HDM2_9HYPH|nr:MULTISPECIES: hypothetical protein [Aureimonas]MBB3934662.1 hypothetical protein [Aureimonas phyllosphaerae]MBB3950527.1 hypothetical protein [Aureimonas jatrophae]MBB3958122.1 hypothetical protein [Aureimonas phyllosphaerae]SDO16951.1 hypothetical protein SAMN05192530_10436 [Aureimonas jatrophae]SFE92166.1 hypothetical protein SAMN05216566_10193 [Aureimonas phyllosphaerae]
MTPERITRIVALIDGWTGRLTWEALCEAVARETGASYRRASLNNYLQIKSAYKAYVKKPNLAPSGDATPAPKPKGPSRTQKKISRLERKVAELTAVNDALLEKFARWAVNAGSRGLDEAFLDQPLVQIKRSENR